MTFLSLIAAGLLAAVPVDVTLLDGTKVTGELKALSRESVQVDAAGETKSLAPADLLQVEFAAAADAVPPADHVEVRFDDGSKLWASNIKIAAGEATFDSPGLGSVKIPTAAIHDLRFGDPTGLGTAWDEMRATDSQKDRIIVRKGDALDFVAGVIGGIDGGQVAVVIGGQEAKVPTSRVFGVLWASEKKRLPSPLCEVVLKNGERLQATELTLAGETATLVTAGGLKSSVPVGGLLRADYGLGRIRSLADVPRQASYEKVNPFWSDDDQARLQNLRVDTVPWGRTPTTPFRIGDKTYAKGLWLHSGTTVRFQLDRQYRKLQATMGLDENPEGRNRVRPKVRVVLSGDGKPLHDQVVAWDQPPVPLDLDVDGVRVLELSVAPAEKTAFYGACEHLDLVETKLIK